MMGTSEAIKSAARKTPSDVCDWIVGRRTESGCSSGFVSTSNGQRKSFQDARTANTETTPRIGRDIGRTTERVINPIYDPPLIAEFVVISPARRTLSTQAQLFLECFEAEIALIQDVWAQTIPPAVYPVRTRRAAAKRAAS